MNDTSFSNCGYPENDELSSVAAASFVGLVLLL